MAKELVVRDVDREHARRYPMTVVADDDGLGYHVDIAAWPYLTGVGDTPEEAVADAVEAVAGALALRAERDLPAPEPLEQYSGQLQLRMPASLHRALAWRAEAEGTSLNATAVMLLTHSLGQGAFVDLPTPRRRRSGGRQVPPAAGA